MGLHLSVPGNHIQLTASGPGDRARAAPWGESMSRSCLMVFSWILLAGPVAYADEAAQTDWSAGPGTPGPWGDWSAGFHICQSCNYSTSLSIANLGLLLEDTDDAVWIETADIDSDGDRDIVVSCQPDSSTDGMAAWWENCDGLGESWECHVVSDSVTLSMNCTHAADLDGDGHPDIVVPVKYSNTIIAYLNADGQGDSWNCVVVEDDVFRPEATSSSDLDGDGDCDLVVCSRYGGTIGWWENVDGTGTSWTAHEISADYPGANYSICIDLDEDGSIDLVTSGDWGGGVCWWWNSDGSGTAWVRRDVAPDLEGAFCVRGADIDADGDLDLVGCSWTENSVYWWENLDGSGLQWTEHLIGNKVTWATSVFAGDFDDDGDVDVLSSGTSYGVILWRNLDGAGSTWEEIPVDRGFHPVERIYADDLDGDGLLEGIGAGFSVNRSIKTWQIDQYESSAWLESTILYLGCDPAWGWIDWNAETPTSTSVAFQVRASDDPVQMGDWSPVIGDPGDLSGILTENDSYFQYRALLATTDSYQSPLLQDVTVAWDPLGLEPGGLHAGTVNLLENPGRGSLEVVLDLVTEQQVDVALHDISGRLVARRVLVAPEGSSSVTFDDLASGLYFCRVVTTTDHIVLDAIVLR